MKWPSLLIPLFLIILAPQLGHAEDSLNSAFSQPTNLTDKEVKDAQDFKNTAREQRIIEERCKEKGQGKCDSSSADISVLGGDFGQILEDKIGFLYGTLFGATSFLSGGGGPQVSIRNKPTEAVKPETPTAGTEAVQPIKADVNGKSTDVTKKSDYCLYAAIGYEMVGGLIQKKLQTDADNATFDEKDIQLKALIGLKKTHEARQKTAAFQRAVYGAVTVCYIARAALSKGRVVMDWKYWAKMAGAGALTTLYWLKVEKHKKAANAVQEVIDSIKQDGNCNPWTATQCFCAEVTSKTTFPAQYEQVCVVNNGDSSLPKDTFGCGVLVDGKMTYDAKCACKAKNTCFKPQLTNFNPSFDYGKNFMNNANAGFDMLSGGLYDAGKFDQYSSQNGVLAAKVRDKISTTELPKIELNPKEKQVADSFKGLLPPAVAGMVAKSPSGNPPGGGLMGGNFAAALDKLPKNLKDKIDAATPVKYSNGGPGFGSTVAPEEPGFVMPQMSGETKAENGTEIVSFAEQAIQNADVSNTPDTPIFDIISNRYRRSSWDKLIPQDH